MKKLFVGRMVFAFSILTMTSACNKKGDANSAAQPAAPAMDVAVALSAVSSDNCLNLEKLSNYIQDPRFTYPASVMTTNFKSLDDISDSKLQYFSFGAYDYKIANANDLGLFTAVKQSDCNTVQMMSASNVPLTFAVSDHSQQELKLTLQNSFSDELTNSQKNSLYSRNQPYEIDIKYISDRQISIDEKYHTIDAICDSKTPLNFEIQKTVSWGTAPTELPKTFTIDGTYFSKVQQAIGGAIPTPDASGVVTVSPQTVTADAVVATMRSPIKEELKLCN